LCGIAVGFHFPRTFHAPQFLSNNKTKVTEMTMCCLGYFQNSLVSILLAAKVRTAFNAETVCMLSRHQLILPPALFEKCRSQSVAVKKVKNGDANKASK